MPDPPARPSPHRHRQTQILPRPPPLPGFLLEEFQAARFRLRVGPANQGIRFPSQVRAARFRSRPPLPLVPVLQATLENPIRADLRPR